MIRAVSSDAPRILILEDDDEMRAMLTDVLDEQGYIVVAVARGEDAVAAVCQEPFDLIVADIRMEGMDGLEAVKRSKMQQPDIGSLVVSGYASEEDTARAGALNVGGYLHKPFRMHQFLALVREQLKGREKEPDLEEAPAQVRSLLWALTSVAELAEASAGTPGVVKRAGQLALSLATRLRMPKLVADELSVAAMLAAVADIPAARPPEFFLRDTSTLPSLTLALANRETLEGRLVAVAREASLQEELPPLEALPLDLEHRLDADLARAYQEMLQNVAEPASQSSSYSARGVRGMLYLARTLEEAGDHLNASKVYESVGQQAPESSFKVSATLGRARIFLAKDDLEGAIRLAQEASAQARALGPMARSKAELDTGLMLLSRDKARAAEFLERAADGMAELGLESGEAKAKVVLASLGREVQDVKKYVELLFSPRHAGEMAESAAWLVPALLGLAVRLRAPNLILRIVAEHPTLTQSILLGTGLSSEDRDYLVAAFEARERALPEPVLLAFSEDQALYRRAAALSGRAGLGASTLLRVSSFGELEVSKGEIAVGSKEWKTAKTRLIFAMLASSWGTAFSEDTILDEFWPDDVEKGRKNLYWSTSVARGCLKMPGGSPHQPEVLLREGGSLWLNPEIAHWHDIEEFRQAYEEGQREAEKGRTREAISHLQRLTTLYQGPYLEGCYMEWAVTVRDRYEREAAEGLLRLSELLLASGQYPGALEASRKALQVAPHRQEAYLVVMRSLLGLDRGEEAMDCFRECEKMLRREYEVEPSTKLLEYYHRARLGMGDAAP